MKRSWISAVALGLTALTSTCGAATPEPDDEAMAAVDRQLDVWVRRDFSLTDKLALDPALRTASDQMAQEQITRIGGLLRTWARKEAATLAPAQRDRELTGRMVARYVNEMALWQLDTAGDAYDGQMLKALLQPGLCAAQVGHPAFAQAMLAIQHLPAAERPVALEAQRELLARWGQRRSSVPDRPMPSVLERAEQAVRSLAGGERPAAEPALPPVLAWVMLSSPPQRMADDTRCALRHWWLRREQARTRLDVAELMRGLRYSSLPEPSERFRRDSDGAGASASGYPAVAARFGIEGKVQMSGTVRSNAPGLDQPQVVSRQIVVPGIRDVRPVVFETTFDTASLARAQTVESKTGAAGQKVTIEFVWRLQP
jgi:hypothetical protein